MRKTKAQKQRETAINKAYYLAFNGVPVNMMDIPAIYKAIGDAVDATLLSGNGKTLADALAALKAAYAK
jgi:hypothetical protein